MSRKWLLTGLAIGVVAVAGVWLGRPAYQTARIGTAYMAKQTCSCRFVAGRSAESCKTDYDPGQARLLTLKMEPDRVTVSALAGIVSATSQFEQGFGCHLVN